MLNKATTLLATLLVAAATLAHAQSDSTSTTSTDPTSSPYPAGFIPKQWPAYTGLAAYAILTIAAWTHWFRTGRPRYLLVLPIGLLTMVIGFAIRLYYITQPKSVGIYAVMTLFILLSPCAYLATNYILLKHLCYSMGEEVTKRCLLFKVRWVVKFFVWMDVITFLVQAGGGGLSATGGSTAKIGEKVSIVGLIIQLVAFVSFTFIFFLFAFRVRQRYPHLWHASSRFSLSQLGPLSISTLDDWRILVVLMSISCVGIIIRSLFRIVEFSQGYRGYLITHEGYFWCLDALPLFVSTGVFTFLLWPERCFRGERHADSMEMAKNGGLSTTRQGRYESHSSHGSGSPYDKA